MKHPVKTSLLQCSSSKFSCAQRAWAAAIFDDSSSGLHFAVLCKSLKQMVYCCWIASNRRNLLHCTATKTDISPGRKVLEYRSRHSKTALSARRRSLNGLSSAAEVTLKKNQTRRWAWEGPLSLDTVRARPSSRIHSFATRGVQKRCLMLG